MDEKAGRASRKHRPGARGSEWGGHPSCAHRALEYSGLGFKASVSERSPQALTSRRHQKERGVKADGLWVVLWDDGMNVLELDRRRGFTTLRMP